MAAILIRRTYGEAGYRKSGPYHLADQEDLRNLHGYPEYQEFAEIRTWCGAKVRYGPADVLSDRGEHRSPLVAKLCRRCFMDPRKDPVEGGGS